VITGASFVQRTYDNVQLQTKSVTSVCMSRPLFVEKIALWGLIRVPSNQTTILVCWGIPHLEWWSSPLLLCWNDGTARALNIVKRRQLDRFNWFKTTACRLTV